MAEVSYAKYVVYQDIDYDDYKDFKNMNDIRNYGIDFEDYNFGDLVSFSSYRDIATFIIGNDGILIQNPDNGMDGYLSIPIEISEYFDNVTEHYKNVEVNSFDLKYDDRYISQNINTKNCKIKESDVIYITLWTFNQELSVTFPDFSSTNFNLKNLTANKIKEWYYGFEN